MEEEKFFLQSEERNITEKLLENVNELVKDSDAVEEKQMVKNFLKTMADVLIFMAIGDEGVGKSNFLNELFQESIVQTEDVEPTLGIREIRRGAQNAEVQVSRYCKKQFLEEERLEGIAVIDTQGINTILDEECKQKLEEYAQKSDVLFVVFSADNIKSFTVWDFLERIENRKVLFIVTGCDLFTNEELEKSEVRLRQYMMDSKINAPIFRVSAKLEKEDEKSKSGFFEVREYIYKNILGENPTIRKQQENMQQVKGMLTALSSSFALRKKQHESDSLILERINHSIDGFCTKNEVVIIRLKEELKAEISKEIDNYQQEIITRLDPHKIKERFKGGGAEFGEYLNFLNEGYRNRMNGNVNRKTQEAVRKYLGDLETVFEEATGYFRKRESLIALEDKFYGSMAASKQEMLVETQHTSVVTSNYYKSLTDASEELFMKIWNARGECDKKTNQAQAIGGLTGAGVGGGLAALLVHSATAVGVTAAGAGATATASGALAGTIASAGAMLWPIVGTIAGAIIIAKIAKKLASAKNEEDMERKVCECIEEFKEEISKTKEEMTGQIIDTIEAIFKRELETVDKSFIDFRMSVNIDSKNISKLEEKLGEVQILLESIGQVERRMLL